MDGWVALDGLFGELENTYESDQSGLQASARHGIFSFIFRWMGKLTLTFICLIQTPRLSSFNIKETKI